MRRKERKVDGEIVQNRKRGKMRKNDEEERKKG